jgi:cytidylate kinase
MIVTMDGPAGSGKSTAARQLAERLAFGFLDTGAMYRAVAYACLERKLSLEDEAAVGKLAQSLRMAFDGDRLFVNGKDVTDNLRSADVTNAASRVAVLPVVREALVKLQREAARGKNMVTEGRDQGTVVFPKALCKFFITADPKERARRRLVELQEQGQTLDLEEVLHQIQERDERDANREIAPLKPAKDALIIDTTGVELSEVLNRLEQIVRERMD